jgi:hypothetical protein
LLTIPQTGPVLVCTFVPTAQESLGAKRNTPAGPSQFAAGITAISPDNVWAVGTVETDGTKTLSAHWNGTA